MNTQANGWIMLLIVVAGMALGFAFTAYETKSHIPAVAAQIGGNQQIIGQLNQVLKQQNDANEKRFTKLEAQVEALRK